MEPMLVLKKLNIFTCNQCQRIFTSLGQLKKHEQIHIHIYSAHVLLKRVKTFNCKECKKCFTNIRDCYLHELLHIELKKPTNDNPDYQTKPYKCNECGVCYVLKSTLTEHSKVHQQLHTCACGIGFYHSLDLRGHVRLVHSNDNILKPKNNKSTETIAPKSQQAVNGAREVQKENEPKKKTGKQIVTKSKPKIVQTVTITDLKTKINVQVDEDGMFVCPKCDKRFSRRQNIKSHYRVHTNLKPYSCKECGMKFRAYNSMMIHKRKHGSPCYICDYCNKGYYVRHLLMVHILGHMGLKPYCCEQCGKRFWNPTVLYSHKRSHTKGKCYNCRYCNKGFTFKNNMETHERIHTGEKPYKCSHCEKAFNDPSALKTHVRIHTKDKRYICKYCQKGFTSSGPYTIHVKRHTNQKNFVCDVCGKRFIMEPFLREHVESVHEKVKNFECAECGRRFYAKYRLKKHIQGRHGLIVLYCHLCMKKFFTDHDLEKHKKRCKKNVGKKKGIRNAVKVVDLAEV